MRRFAILTIALATAVSAFGQAKPAQGAAAAPAAAPAPAPTGPHPKSPEENAAVVAMLKAADPDSQIKAAEDLLAKFPDTDYKASALLVAGQGYSDKKDYPHAISKAEQGLEADPKNYELMLLLAEVTSRGAKSTDLNLPEELATIDKNAKDAIAEIATAAKPKPDLADADWAGIKTQETQRAWVSMGYGALLAKKYDDAKADFAKGTAAGFDPLDALYIERAYETAKQWDEALAWNAKATGSPNANDTVKRIGGSDKTRIEAKKKAAGQ